MQLAIGAAHLVGGLAMVATQICWMVLEPAWYALRAAVITGRMILWK